MSARTPLRRPGSRGAAGRTSLTAEGTFTGPRPPGGPRVLGLACVLLAGVALAGGRARFGGTLPVALVTKGLESRALYADTPTDAVAQSLVATPLCRLVDVSSPGPGALRLSPHAGVAAADVAAALERVASGSSPYRALLSGVARWKADSLGVELTLSGPTADLPRGLCHPAFGVSPGPFQGLPRATASPTHPDGRPFLDGVTVSTGDARAAERAFAQRKVGLVVGGASTVDEGPQLFVTVLVFPPALRPHLSTAVESTVDRGDLVRFFLRPPSAPLHGLLPVSLGGPAEPTPRPARPPALSPPREVTVTWDAGADVERAIAERLQVKLQPLGYRVALKATPRDEVRARAASSQELTLQSLLLPPSPTAALAVLIEASGQRAQLSQALAAIAAAPDPDVKARELAVELLPRLPLLPLATRGVALAAQNDLQHLTRDALGLPRLADVFYAPE